MPVTFNTTQIKYKDQQGNYVGINGVAERTTNEQIAEIQAAAEAAKETIPPEIDEVWQTIEDMNDNFVKVSETAPHEQVNRIWVQENPDEVMVPTDAELDSVVESIAPDYSDLTYPVAAGTLCTHSRALYKAKVDIESADEWDSTKWDAVDVTDELGRVDGRIDDVSSAFDSITEETINIWDETWKIGIISNTGSWTPNPSTPAIISNDLIPCDPSTTYYAKTPAGNSIRIAEYRSDKSFIGFIGYKENTTFTTGANTAYIRFNSAGIALSQYGNNISINKCVGDYEKYYPHITPVDVVSRYANEKNASDISGVDTKADGITTRIDGMYSNTPNMWDEETYTHAYINNNGQPATASTPAWCAKNYIEVSPSTKYYLYVGDRGACRVAQYRADKTFISFLGYIGNGYFTTDAETAYVLFWKGGSDTYSNNVAMYSDDSVYYAYMPHISLTDYVARANIDKLVNEFIVVGQGQQYTTVVAGFSAAVAQGKGCIILPGLYDLVSEGASAGVGITAPKHIIGYGAKIVASLSAENWSYSAINLSKDMDEVIIEGLEIEVTNCRYCVHDEQYNRAGYYHHVFKNCKMKHNSNASTTLIRPVCIGGGFGNSCLVEIENCEFSSKDDNNNDVNYHANSLGQTGNCIVKCRDSVFETSIGITGNAQTGFVNEMYVCGCLCGTLPTDPNIANSKMIQWNNVVRSN